MTDQPFDVSKLLSDEYPPPALDRLTPAETWHVRLIQRLPIALLRANPTPEATGGALVALYLVSDDGGAYIGYPTNWDVFQLARQEPQALDAADYRREDDARPAPRADDLDA